MARDLTAYPGKPLTELQEHLAQWLMDKCGYDPKRDAHTKMDAFLMGVKLSAVLRMDHQRSPENQDRLATIRWPRKAKKAAKKIAAKTGAKKAKRSRKRRHLVPVNDEPEVALIRNAHPVPLKRSERSRMPRPLTPAQRKPRPEADPDLMF